LFTACLNEDDRAIGKPDTFLRYFSGGFNETAVAFEQTADDGFVILTNVDARLGESASSKMKLYKTDVHGNLLWTEILPAPNGDFFDATQPQVVGYGLILSKNGGYLITGEWTRNGVPRPFVLRAGEDGKQVRLDSIAGLRGRRGVGLAETNTELLVLGVNPSDTALNQKMFLASYGGADFQRRWLRQYGDGTGGGTNITPRLLLNSGSQAIWTGTVARTSGNDIRMVKAEQNSQRVIFDLPIGNPGNNETAADITPFASGYAIIGTTNVNGNDDIFFQRVNEDGSTFTNSQKIVSTKDPQKSQFNETGYALTATRDGGIVLLGSYDSQSDDLPGETGRGFDLQLIKIDAFGNEIWRQRYGNQTNDVGVAVRQARDGSLVVLGSTNLANLRVVMLLKTDKNGEIQ
jgi:hypothetical protein